MSNFLQWLEAVAYANLKYFAIAVGISCAFWIVELIKPSTKDHGLRSRLPNLKIYALLLLGLVLSTPIINFCSQLIPSISLIDRLLPTWNKQGILGGVLATFVYAAVWDFFQYWTHRLEHHLPVLWTFHRTHHSDTHMNSTTSRRQSIWGVLLGFMLTHMPTALICGGGLLPYLGSVVLFNSWGHFNHANIKIPLGPLTAFISGPQLHRIHHGKTRNYHNCNYAAFFPFYDWLFGTLRLPQRSEWVETGIENDLSSRNSLKQVFAPWLNEPPGKGSKSLASTAGAAPEAGPQAG